MRFMQLVRSLGGSQKCRDEDTGWEKIVGAKPVDAAKVILYRNDAIGNNGIITPCFNRWTLYVLHADFVYVE